MRTSFRSMCHEEELPTLAEVLRRLKSRPGGEYIIALSGGSQKTPGDAVRLTAIARRPLVLSVVRTYSGDFPRFEVNGCPIPTQRDERFVHSLALAVPLIVKSGDEIALIAPSYLTYEAALMHCSAYRP